MSLGAELLTVSGNVHASDLYAPWAKAHAAGMRLLRLPLGVVQSAIEREIAMVGGTPSGMERQRMVVYR